MSSAKESFLRMLAKSDNDMFIPKKLETVKFEGKTLSAYPVLDTDALNAEKVHTLLCNRQAAEASNLGPYQTITFTASRSNLDATARVLISQWMGRLSQLWCVPDQLEVLSYHDPTGAVIADAIDPATGVLRPIDDGDETTRRPANVRFVQVRIRVDYHYQDLHFKNDPCEVRLDYFIPLPVGTVTFNNVAGVPVNRFTCTIPGNPFALMANEFLDQVVHVAGINGPCGLLPPVLGGTECQIDENYKWVSIQTRILATAKDSILHNLREQAAPGFSSTAFSTVEKISMSYQDENGNLQVLPVIDYHAAILQASGTFLEDDVYQYNIANHFVHHLERSVRDLFNEECKAHLTFNDLSRDAQLRQLQRYLLIATKCEKKIRNTQRIVKSSLSNSHTFLTQLLAKQPADSAAESVLMSVAEKTLRKEYKGATRGDLNKLAGKVAECWGCKGNHSWCNRKTKEITCPNKDKPGVTEHAKLMHKQYLESLKERRQNWTHTDKIKFSQLSTAQKEVARQYFVSESQAIVAAAPSPSVVSPLTTDASTRASHDDVVSNLPTVLVCSYSNGKPLLPIQIDGQLPHITLVLGELDSPLESCAIVRALFDTGASMNSGRTGFWLPVLRAHPEILEELYTSDNGDYNPIILGGIVTGQDGDMSKHTTALTLVAKIKLRYETIHHQPVSMTIALGNDIGVNTIVGKPFCKGMQCVHDSFNNTVDAKLLNVAPFPVTEMFPQSYNSHDKVKESGNPTYTSIVSKLDSLIETYCPVKKEQIPSTLGGYLPVKKIRFGETTYATVGLPNDKQPTDPRPGAKALRGININLPPLSDSDKATLAGDAALINGSVTDTSSVDSSLFGDVYESIE
jgi:hypothetical protein